LNGEKSRLKNFAVSATISYQLRPSLRALACGPSAAGETREALTR